MVSRRVVRAVTPPTNLNFLPQLASRLPEAIGPHDLIADSICGWVYSGLSNMKARWSIAGALLFAHLVAPSALWASARLMGPSACHVAKPQVHTNDASTRKGGNLVRLVSSGPSHHTPAPRLHRIRGKKIGVQGSTILALECFAATRLLVPDSSSGLQDIDGPNPSRGPPSHYSL
jgi:hypothetical protein